MQKQKNAQTGGELNRLFGRRCRAKLPDDGCFWGVLYHTKSTADPLLIIFLSDSPPILYGCAEKSKRKAMTFGFSAACWQSRLHPLAFEERKAV
jgi:hypothetical protein